MRPWHPWLAALAVDTLRRERVTVIPVAHSPSVAEVLAALAVDPSRLPVWTGESSRTVWGPPRFNLAFRAWHDLRHAELDAPGDLPGELAVLARQLRDIPGRRPHARELLAIEVAGFARYHAAHGAFPRSQLAFARAAGWSIGRAIRGRF